MDFADPMNFYGASSETDGIIGDENSITSASGLGLDNRGDPMVIDAEGYVCHHIPVVPSATLTPTQYTPISTSPGAALFCPHHAVPVNICSPALVQAADNFGSVPVHGFSPTPFGEEFSGPYPSIQPTTASHQHSDTYYTNPPTPSAPHAMTRQQYSGPLSHHSPMNASPGPYSTDSPRPLGHPSFFPASSAAHSHDSPLFVVMAVVVVANPMLLGVIRLEDAPLEDAPLEDTPLQMANSYQIIRIIHSLLLVEEGLIPTKILAEVIIRVITKDLHILQTITHLGTKTLSTSFRFLEFIAACTLSFLITLGPP